MIADSPVVAKVAPSPNHGERRAGARIDSVVLHYTGMPTAEGAVALLRDPASQVSSHYVVEETGRIVQLVPESRRAWHAGQSFWRGERDLNSVSIGIEICNAGHAGGLPPFPEAQIAAVIALGRDLAARHALRPERWLAHSDIAPRRKQDPGENFPWDALARARGLWVEPEPPGEPLIAAGQEGPHARGLQALLTLYGYEVEPSGVCDAMTRTVVTAFQRRYRPGRIDGLADASVVSSLRRLLALTQAAPATCKEFA